MAGTSVPPVGTEGEWSIRLIRGKLDKQALVISFDGRAETYTVTQARMIPNKFELPKVERRQLISGRWQSLSTQDFDVFNLAWDFTYGIVESLKAEGYKVSVLDNTTLLPPWP